MNNVDCNVKLIYSELCMAMQRNVSNNFQNISFDIINNGDIQVKIMLYSQSDDDYELIDDLIAEFSSTRESNDVLKPLVSINSAENPLKYLIYQTDKTHGLEGRDLIWEHTIF